MCILRLLRVMPGALVLLNKHVLAAAFVVLVLIVLESHAAVWPGHVQFSLGLLDGTDGFRITADASDGRLGYSVSAAGVRQRYCRLPVQQTRVSSAQDSTHVASLNSRTRTELT